VLSRPLDETIIFTHERLFLPQGPPVMPPLTAPRLFEIRRLIDQGLYKQATELAFNLTEQEGFSACFVLLTFLSNFCPLTSFTTYFIEKPCGQTQRNWMNICEPFE
jgi:hypothetical protein